MAEFIAGVLFLPTLWLLVVVADVVFGKTNTTWVQCRCGVEWRPKQDGWTRGGEKVRLFAHDHTRKHKKEVDRG